MSEVSAYIGGFGGGLVMGSLSGLWTDELLWVSYTVGIVFMVGSTLYEMKWE